MTFSRETSEAVRALARPPNRPGQLRAIAASLLVVIIWGSSFVFVKRALDTLGPLTIAGLRYFLAFLVLLPLVIRRGRRNSRLTRALWLRLFLIGLSAYAVGNGALFWGLKYLPATTGSFMMSFIPLLVLFLSIAWLREIPTGRQVAGVIVSLIGSGLFFADGLRAGQPLGIAIVGSGLIGFAAFAILGRGVARLGHVDTLLLTAWPLGFGGGLLLLVAMPIEGLPNGSAEGYALVLLLAIVNTALAYLLYNHSLQTLTAVEMNAILNLSPLATAIIAWLLLSERLAANQIVGMLIVIGGVFLVQRSRSKPAPAGALRHLHSPQHDG